MKSLFIHIIIESQDALGGKNLKANFVPTHFAMGRDTFH